MTVYEVGYLLASSIPEERISVEVDNIKKIITDAGAVTVSEEDPHLQPLAYTIRTKNISGSYEKYDEAYFGWIKFEVASGAVESIKKSIEILPSIVRLLLITTVRENTYLGKRASAIMKAEVSLEDKTPISAPGVGATEIPAVTATVEEMDKSIDDMVKVL